MARSVKPWSSANDNAMPPPRARSARGCSIAGCNGLHDSFGYCGKHAHRFRRHGDPLGGTTDKHACSKFINSVILAYSDNDCLRWPFGNNGKGYGVYHVNRRPTAVHVYICELVHGQKPTPKHEVAHSCGKGHLGCVNPCHLRWATRSENHMDKRMHGTAAQGTKNPRNKLSEENVLVIRSLLGKLPQHAIADKFGVCQMTISHIATRKQWGWLL